MDKIAYERPSIRTANEEAGPPANNGSIKEDQCPSKAGDIYWKPMGGEAFVFTTHDVKMHSFNSTGTRIWDLIDGTRSVKEIMTAVYQERDVERDRFDGDVLSFLSALVNKRIITVNDGPSTSEQ